MDGSSTGTWEWGAGEASHNSEEPNIQTIKTIGLDIAKSVFQVHGIDAAGSVTVRCQLKRRYVLAFFEKLAPCLIGIEACASGGNALLRSLQIEGGRDSYGQRRNVPRLALSDISLQCNDLSLSGDCVAKVESCRVTIFSRKHETGSNRQFV